MPSAGRSGTNRRTRKRNQPRTSRVKPILRGLRQYPGEDKGGAYGRNTDALFHDGPPASSSRPRASRVANSTCRSLASFALKLPPRETAGDPMARPLGMHPLFPRRRAPTCFSPKGISHARRTIHRLRAPGSPARVPRPRSHASARSRSSSSTPKRRKRRATPRSSPPPPGHGFALAGALRQLACDSSAAHSPTVRRMTPQWPGSSRCRPSETIARRRGSRTVLAEQTARLRGIARSATATLMAARAVDTGAHPALK